MTTYFQIHTLTTLTGNPNRDEFGRPKDLLFGGIRRQRLSSQSIKRAVRRGAAFRAALDTALLGVRTRALPAIVAAQLASTVSDQVRRAVIEAVIRSCAGGGGKEEAVDEEAGDEELGGEITTKRMLFFTPAEAREIATRLVNLITERGAAAVAKLDQKALLAALGDIALPHGPDVALFGRMNPSSPLKDVDGAVSVAHAMGTHRHALEYDFFTAFDDVADQAGFLDTAGTPFASTTFYGYAVVDVGQLTRNLSGDEALAATTTAAFAQGMLTSTPTGMAHRFAHYARPGFVLMEIGEEQPCTLANAFIDPVFASAEQGQFAASRTALIAHADDLTRMYSRRERRAYLSPAALEPGQLRGADDADARFMPSMDALLAWLRGQLKV